MIKININQNKNQIAMKKLISILCLILIISSCKKEEVFTPSLTREFSILSVTNGANYPIKVALPQNYNPSEKYSTIYVLDGEDNFSYVANNCKEISANYGTKNIIVVAIGYGNDRSFDYTPTKADHDGGGAEKFVLFIQNELIPKMENEFSADTTRASRIILGHSFGGLLAAYVFTNHNGAFGNYLMLSPSIWYDNEIILKLEKEYRDLNKNAKQLVFLGLGSLESNGRMLAPFEAFYQILRNNYPSLNLAKKIQQQLDHLGSKNPNIQEALQFYFQNR